MRLITLMGVCSGLFVSSAFAKSIVVVGAGLAGLTATYELQKQIKQRHLEKDVQVHLYEAKDRAGGRVFTVTLNRQPAELGGENINDGGEAPNIRKLAKELKLRIDSYEVPKTQRVFIDSKTGEQLTLDDLKPFFPKISSQELTATLLEGSKNAKNLKQVVDYFFQKYAVTDEIIQDKRRILREAFENFLRGYEGGELENLSPRYAQGSLAWSMSSFTQSYKPKLYRVDKFVGGNSRLVEALMKKLGNKVHLEKPLLSVKQTSHGAYELTFGGATKEVVRADIVIFAIPAKPFKNISFGENTIESARLDKISSMSYGTHAKILVPAPQTFKRSFVSARDFTFWHFPKDEWLTLYFSGTSGIMPTKDLFTINWEKAAQALFPLVKIPSPKDVAIATRAFESHPTAVTYNWASDPYFQGSYSYSAATHTEEIDRTITVNGEFMLPLFAPIQNKIFFAGEHTTYVSDNRGTMEAAVESGYRTARSVWKSFRH